MSEDLKVFHVVIEMQIDDDDRARLFNNPEDSFLFDNIIPVKIIEWKVVSPTEPSIGSVVLCGEVSYGRESDGWWYQIGQPSGSSMGLSWDFVLTYSPFTLFEAPMALDFDSD